MQAMRDATREVHQTVEALLDVGRPNAGREAYRDYLVDLRGWLKPFERQLWNAAWPQEIQAQQRSDKVAWIDADLRMLGMDTASIASLPQAGFVPSLATPGQCFGTAYVIEGAQLGTKVLYKSLAPQLGGWKPRWLEGYGSDAGRYWRVFMHCAEHCLHADDLRRDAADAAFKAFASLAGWFEEQRKLREVCIAG